MVSPKPSLSNRNFETER